MFCLQSSHLLFLSCFNPWCIFVTMFSICKRAGYCESQSSEYFKVSAIESLTFLCTCKPYGFRRGQGNKTRSRNNKTATRQWYPCLNNSPTSEVYLIGLPLSVLKRLYFPSSLWQICLIWQLKKTYCLRENR